MAKGVKPWSMIVCVIIDVILQRLFPLFSKYVWQPHIKSKLQIIWNDSAYLPGPAVGVVARPSLLPTPPLLHHPLVEDDGADVAPAVAAGGGAALAPAAPGQDRPKLGEGEVDQVDIIQCKLFHRPILCQENEEKK